jgi:hypothetical protein
VPQRDWFQDRDRKQIGRIKSARSPARKAQGAISEFAGRRDCHKNRKYKKAAQFDLPIGAARHFALSGGLAPLAGPKKTAAQACAIIGMAPYS